MKKTCAIMQPAYLPWSGFFNLIAEADVFIFLDDVQFTTGDKNSWQNRNRILMQGKPHHLTVPAIREHLGQPLNTIRVDDKQNWRKKHLTTLRQIYSRQPFGAEMVSIVEPTLQSDITLLAELTSALILEFSKVLKLDTEFHHSSKLNITAARTERLVKMCQHFGCTEYLSPARAQEYLEADGDFSKSDVQVRYQAFTPAPYPQKDAPEFVSHLSIVDVFAALGPEKTAAYVRGA